MGPCLLWSGERTSKGYGRVRIAGKWHRTHRLAWEKANGSIPGGMSVLHRCDNPPCVNPAHLFLGTDAENVADCIAKGRHATVKLTLYIARDIKRLHKGGSAMRAIAKHFQIDRNTVRDIVRGKTWRVA